MVPVFLFIRVEYGSRLFPLPRARQWRAFDVFPPLYSSTNDHLSATFSAKRSSKLGSSPNTRPVWLGTFCLSSLWLFEITDIFNTDAPANVLAVDHNGNRFNPAALHCPLVDLTSRFTACTTLFTSRGLPAHFSSLLPTWFFSTHEGPLNLRSWGQNGSMLHRFRWI